jgi:hypothetical protein
MTQTFNRVDSFVVGSFLVVAWASFSFGCGGGDGVGGNKSTDADAGEARLMAAFSDADTPNVGDAGPAGSACLHYYAAQYTRCGGPVLPASEEARQQARFVQVCLNDIGLPGSGMTIAAVAACASALDASPCEFPAGQPQACNFHGSLPGGRPCNEGLQCQSGQCQGTAAISPEGPIGPFTCGACAPFVQTGQVCGQGNFSGGCTSDEICLIGAGMETAAMPTYTCVAITQGDVGATCDDLSALCKTGLYCAAQTGTCSMLADAGAPCGDGAKPPGNPGGCVAPLACVGTPGACASGGVGSPCTYDPDCAPGLGCAQTELCTSTGSGTTCSSSGTCSAITWAIQGQACDGGGTRCLVGTCGNGGSGLGIPIPVSEDGGSPMVTCPMIATDGQPCNSQCDVLAECFSPTGKAGTSGLMGTCTLLDSVVCQ